MSYLPALPDWEHQTTAKKRMHLQPYFALFMEMGTGKTKTIIDEFCEYFEDGIVDTVVIIAKKGTYMNWVRTEIALHMPQRIYDQSVIRVWHQGGGNTEQRRQLHELLQVGPWLRVLIINTEAFSVGDKAERFTAEFLRGATVGAYFALDESTSARNHTSKRTQSLTRVAHHERVRFRRIMTGLPNPRAPLDLFAQAEILRRGLLGQSFFAFRARYAILRDMKFGGRKVTVVDGYRNTEELADRIKPWSYRVLKKDCLDIPDKVYTSVDVELTDEQHRIYGELRRYALSEIGEGVVSTTSVITQLLRLQQIVCGHVPNDLGERQEVPTRRIEALMDVVEEALEERPDRKFVIWTRFRPDVERIVAALSEKYPALEIAQFHGGNAKTRHLDSERFQKDPRCQFMVATYAGGHGNTWTASDFCIYYSNDFDLELRLQSEDRLHRGGQKNVVTYVDLVARGTVDEKIIDALRKKIVLAASITGDEARAWLE